MREDLKKPPPAGKTNRRAVDATLAEWRSRGHLTGPENAGRRAVLRELAHAADVAAACESAGTASSFSRARVLAELADRLDKNAPPSKSVVNQHDQVLESRALSIIADLDNTASAFGAGDN